MNSRIASWVLVVLVAGLGSAIFLTRRANADLTARVARLSRQNAELRYEAKMAMRRAEEFSRKAIELDSQLGAAKTRTTATESRQSLLTRELTAREQREVALMAELATAKQKLAAASAPAETSRGEVAAAPVGARAPAGQGLGDGRIPPAAEPAVDVSSYRDRIADLERQLAQLLTRALAGPPEPDAPAPPEPFQVVRVGPRDAFVVIDYGAEQGARPGQIVGLWRGMTEAARVQISEARPRFSLAQVLSATLKGQLQTGDLVVLTN